MRASTDDSLLPVIRAALDHTRSPTVITNADLDYPGPEIVYVNAAYCAMLGRSADELIGKTPRIMQGPLTSRSVLDRLRNDLEEGRPFIGEAVNYRGDGTPFIISWRIDPILDDTGTTTHYIAAQEDVTELRRAQRLLAAEKAIDRSLSELVGARVDAEGGLQQFAADVRSAIGDLVDYGEITVAGSIRLGTTVAETRAGLKPEPASICSELTDLGGPAVVGNDGDRHWVGCRVGNTRTGAEGSVVVWDLTKEELDFIDVAALERVVECAQRAGESLAEYGRQRLTALELQQSLLPAGEPTARGLQVAARYLPGAFASRIGGDWYDVVEDDERVVLVVGDLAGSGVRAAADMGRVRLLTRVLLRQGADVAQVFGELNRFCAEEDLVATALAITIEPQSGLLSIVTAGHPPPLLRRGDGAGVLTVRPGPLLGLGGAVRYPARAVQLGGDDVVVMFTDGLVERRDEDLDTSIQRAVDELGRLPGDVTSVADGLLAARVGQESSDDIALVAFALGPEADEA